MTGRVHSRGGEVGEEGTTEETGSKVTLQPGKVCSQRWRSNASWALGKSRGSGCSRERREKGLGEKQIREWKEENTREEGMEDRS